MTDLENNSEPAADLQPMAEANAAGTTRPESAIRNTTRRLFMDPRRFAGWISAAVFALFAGQVLWYRDAAGIDSPDLGVSRWADRGPTEARLKEMVASILNKEALATELFENALKGPSEWVVTTTADPADKPPKVREAFKAIADVLEADAAQARLVQLWTDDLAGEARQHTILKRVSTHFRPEHLRQPTPTIEATSGELATDYFEALVRVSPRWTVTILPGAAIRGLLRDQQLAIEPPLRSGTATHRAARVARPAALTPPIVGAVAPGFIEQVHGATITYLSNADVRSELQNRIAIDLRFTSAQASLVTAIEKDFSSRWMWIVTAAVFVTAAVSAAFGSGWRIWSLRDPSINPWPLIAFCVAVVASLVYGWTIRGTLPLFLSTPLESYGSYYSLDIRAAARLLNVATAIGVVSLFMVSWSSFLLRTQDDDHLDTQLGTLRWSFNTATFVLVAGVFHLFAFLQWPSSFLAESAAAAIQAGAKTSALALGAVFSGLLLLIYVPGAGALVQEARLRQPDGDAKQAERITQMLTRHGFDTSATQQIATFFKVFAPLLAASVGSEVFSLLG